MSHPAGWRFDAGWCVLTTTHLRAPTATNAENEPHWRREERFCSETPGLPTCRSGVRIAAPAFRKPPFVGAEGGVRWAGLRFLFGLLLATFVVVPLGNNHMRADTAAEFWFGSGPIEMGIYWLLHAIATWLMVLGMLGLAQRWFTRVNPKFAYVAEAAFWIYLAHLPFAVFIPILLHSWTLDADLKMWIAMVIVLALCFASYHFLVRGTVIQRWLRGRYRRSDRPRSASVSGATAE